MKNYFLKHYKSSNSGWGKDVESHKFWLMLGHREPGSIVEYQPGDKTFRYCHVADDDENVLLDISVNKVLSENRERPHDFDNHDRKKKFLLQVCDFLNSGQTLKDSKGFFYISEFAWDIGESNYTLNLIRSDESRPNETRKKLGGFINKATGDAHLFEFYCFGRKMRDNRKKLMKQICNACNQGLIDF